MECGRSNHPVHHRKSTSLTFSIIGAFIRVQWKNKGKKKRRLPLVGRSKSQLLQNEKLVGSCYGVRVKYIIGISFVRFGLKY